MEIESHSEHETAQIAADLAQKLTQQTDTKALVIALEGELGAGKTTFVKGFAHALGITEHITSPTFVILKSYKLQSTSYKSLIHIDAYRLKDHTELEALDFKSLLAKPDAIILVEWAERVSAALPKNHVTVHIDHIDEHTRKITISNFK